MELPVDGNVPKPALRGFGANGTRLSSRLRSHRRSSRCSTSERSYAFQFLMKEVAIAVQYRVLYILVMLNNAYYMGLSIDRINEYEPTLDGEGEMDRS